MGFFSKLLGGFSKRNLEQVSDEDIRGHVLGDYPASQQQPEEEFSEPLEQPQFTEPPDLPPEISRRDFGYPEKRFKPAGQPASSPEDVEESLAIIQNQLATIRAQTETINERLKNMEFLLRNKQAVRY